MVFPLTYGEYQIDTDPARLDLAQCHAYIASTYWAKDIPLATFRRSVEGALCFGVYHHGQQVGFARVISDYATIAYLGDVFIAPDHRGQGLSKWLMDSIISHPDLQGLRRWILLTGDAHGLYQQYGFTPLAAPERWMERAHLDIYTSS
ncbi:N-acetyltransferase [Chitinimonas prasina]|uniref:N-acetyltransferase n=1 Tax=Chitinimonas prasina TaxID=1434937 RepID=A0ABQ5YGK9_9NEIS|nr:GNAT family N-acetyltransferase [Chitinimonas prasina]GLR12475.1 N-acetyltransferase [Chitinimonas prasina]